MRHLNAISDCLLAACRSDPLMRRVRQLVAPGRAVESRVFLGSYTPPHVGPKVSPRVGGEASSASGRTSDCPGLLLVDKVCRRAPDVNIEAQRTHCTLPLRGYRGPMSLIVLADRATDEAKWLAERRKIVTASEACHLMGTADKSWCKSKSDLAKEKLSGDRGFVSPRMVAGTFWEPHIKDYFSACSGINTGGDTRLYGNTESPWLGASIDGWVNYVRPLDRTRMPLEAFLTVYLDGETYEGAEAVQSLLEASQGQPWCRWDISLGLEGWANIEVKNQASKDRPKWNKPEGAPAYYETQAQAQMAVVPVDVVLLVACVDRNEIYCHVIRRDEFFIELYRETARAFVEEFLAPR